MSLIFFSIQDNTVVIIRGKFGLLHFHMNMRLYLGEDNYHLTYGNQVTSILHNISKDNGFPYQGQQCKY